MSFFKKKLPSSDHLEDIPQAEYDAVPSLDEFLKDWNNVMVFHEGQKQLFHAFFDEGKRYIFNRRGRKGAKSTDNIMIAWRYCMENPRRFVKIHAPQKVHAQEIYWDEGRLQYCDAKDSYMQDKYVRYIDNRNLNITFHNGSKITLAGTWTEKRGRGTQDDMLIFDEVKDCDPNFLEAAFANLSVKPDSRLILSGTPPLTKTHFHEWEDRIRIRKDGVCFKHSSYVNTGIPHLAQWLDETREELYAVGKEHVWLTEYMAEDCFASEDRMLPDVSLTEFEEIVEMLRLKRSFLMPFVAMLYTDKTVCAIIGAAEQIKHQGTRIYVLECQTTKKLWNSSFLQINQKAENSLAQLQFLFDRNWTRLIWDESESFTDVISGYQKARKDLKWKQRGAPLLKEMILNGHIFFSDRVPDIGIECLNYLKNEDILNFPTVSVTSMIVNELYQAPLMSRREKEEWDRLAPLREAGLIPPVVPKKGVHLFSKSDLKK